MRGSSLLPVAWYQSVPSVINHRVRTVSTWRSSWNLRQPRLCFRAANSWQSLRIAFPLHNTHYQTTSLHFKPLCTYGHRNTHFVGTSSSVTIYESFNPYRGGNSFHGNYRHQLPSFTYSYHISVHHHSHQIEKNEMGGACSAYGREERHIQGLGGETWGKETTWNTQA